jgi:hypothetical protein
MVTAETKRSWGAPLIYVPTIEDSQHATRQIHGRKTDISEVPEAVAAF